MAYYQPSFFLKIANIIDLQADLADFLFLISHQLWIVNLLKAVSKFDRQITYTVQWWVYGVPLAI